MRNTTVLVNNNYSRLEAYDFIEFNVIDRDLVEILFLDGNKVASKHVLNRQDSAEFMRECRRSGMTFA